MSNILTVSEQATTQLKKIIKSAPSGTIGFLVGIDKSGCNGYSYKLDFVKKNEVENFDFIQQNSVKVFIDPKAVMYLLGTEMDYKKEEFSSSFVFNNPNETERCGCGESFKV